MTTPEERQQALEQILAERVLVLDGAMGTMLQQRDLTADGFRRRRRSKGCNENLVRTRPDVVLGIHRAYFAAGVGHGRDQHLRRHAAGAGRVRIWPRTRTS